MLSVVICANTLNASAELPVQHQPYTFTVPTHQNFLADPDHFLSQGTSQQIGQIAQELFEKTGVQLALVVDSTLPSTNYLRAANQIRHDWKLGDGYQTPAILILVNPENHSSYTLIDHSIEPFLNQELMRTINVYFIDLDSREGNLNQGVYLGVAVYAKIIGKAYKVSIDSIYPHTPLPGLPKTYSQNKALDHWLITLSLIGYGAVILLFTKNGKHTLKMLLLKPFQYLQQVFSKHHPS